MIFTAGVSPLDNFLQFMGLLLLFIIILAVTYFTTRFIGNFQSNQYRNTNFKNIEIYKISPNKYLQLVQIGNRYFILAVGKNDITFITELNKEEINQGNINKPDKSDFAKNLFRAINKTKKDEDKG